MALATIINSIFASHLLSTFYLSAWMTMLIPEEDINFPKTLDLLEINKIPRKVIDQ